MVLSDDFIESIISTDNQVTEDETMISREFYGMEAVAQFDEEFMDACAQARGEEE